MQLGVEVHGIEVCEAIRISADSSENVDHVFVVDDLTGNLLEPVCANV